jgi:hypothetical protein
MPFYRKDKITTFFDYHAIVTVAQIWAMALLWLFDFSIVYFVVLEVMKYVTILNCMNPKSYEVFELFPSSPLQKNFATFPNCLVRFEVL